jgi:hypothetical protein
MNWSGFRLGRARSLENCTEASLAQTEAQPEAPGKNTSKSAIAQEEGIVPEDTALRGEVVHRRKTALRSETAPRSETALEGERRRTRLTA